jgi:hypothetical protein
MMFRKPDDPGRLQPAAHGSSRFHDSLAVDDGARVRRTDWRALARAAAQRLMPAMVLVAAALLGLAAVAIA